PAGCARHPCVDDARVSADRRLRGRPRAGVSHDGSVSGRHSQHLGAFGGRVLPDDRHPVLDRAGLGVRAALLRPARAPADAARRRAARRVGARSDRARGVDRRAVDREPHRVFAGAAPRQARRHARSVLGVTMTAVALARGLLIVTGIFAWAFLALAVFLRAIGHPRIRRVLESRRMLPYTLFTWYRSIGILNAALKALRLANAPPEVIAAHRSITLTDMS